jgi:endonuclease YncB( thermonuclease family)
MTWRSVGYEWAAVVFLLCVLMAIQYFKPDWTGIDVGPRAQQQNSYHAIDGDSFKAGETEIRLYGIDAPEYRQTCSDAHNAPQPCGKMARDALSKLISARTIHCTIIERDRYGRQVSICMDGKVDINREMVRLGWAVAYRKHSMSYAVVEEQAKSATRGIWAWRFEMPEDYRRKNRAVQSGLVTED